MLLPKSFVLELKKKFKVETFIETGTYNGDTAIWASANFNTTTIEFSQEIYNRTVAKFQTTNPNIKFLFGDSKVILKEIVPDLANPAIFWLDGHWSVGDTYGENDECPVLQEIQAIVASAYPHYIFIDDAQYFLSPPPLPHKIEQWPTIDAIMRTLSSGKNAYYIIIVNDVIIAVPENAKSFVSSYYQDENTKTHYQERDRRLQEEIAAAKKTVQKKKGRFARLVGTISSIGHKNI